MSMPSGWVNVPLSKLGTWVGGGTPSTTNAEYWTNGTIPWVSPKDMKQRHIKIVQDYISEAAVRASATNLVPKNSVLLVTRSGILRHSLPVALNALPVTINQDIKALTPIADVSADYLFFAFRRFERDILLSCCKAGTTVQSIELPRLMDFEVPVPPKSEQSRIVAKIEELFSELDKSIENLKLARAQLDVYRQAMFNLAFKGNQACNPYSLVRLGSLIEKPLYGTSKKCDYESVGVGVLRIPNITGGRIDSSDMKYAIFSVEEIESYALKCGDLLMVRSNGSVSIVGRCARVDEAHQHFLFAGYLIRLRPKSGLDSKFLLYQLESHSLRSQIENAAKSTSGVNNINAGEIGSLVISICSIEEQRVVVKNIDAQLEAIKLLEKNIGDALLQAEALRQSILKKAFAGELVQQDASDEPATDLLARIRAEQVERPRAPRKGARDGTKYVQNQ